MQIFNNSKINILIILNFFGLFNCLEEDNFELLKYKETKTFLLNTTETYIRLYMEVDKIKSKMIYFYIYQTDPTKFDFSYTLLKEGEPTDFKELNNYAVINHGSDHTIYYKIKKPNGNGFKLYIKINTRNSYEGQKLSIESTESIIEINLILGLVLGFIIIISLIIIIVVNLKIYQVKRDKSITESNEDVIIEKVGPEDFAPLK